MNERHRILLVDDEPNVLSGLSRQLRGQFQISTANSGQEALDLLQTTGPFAVVMSDMRMPNMNGVELLSAVRERRPDAVRIILSGQSDFIDSIKAVNEGRVFRFLLKPCHRDELRQVLGEATRQYELVIAERQLLRETLRGAVQSLFELLSLSSPAVFGRAAHVRDLVRAMAERDQVEEIWPLEVAAAFSQAGLVTIPASVIERHDEGEPLSPAETEMFERVPQVSLDLLASIPRLESVREILRWRDLDFDGQNGPLDSPTGRAIPWGARAIRVAAEYDRLLRRRHAPERAIALLRSSPASFDPSLVGCLAESRAVAGEGTPIERCPLAALRPGMRFVEDVFARNGLLLACRGQQVNPELIARLTNFAAGIGLIEPFPVTPEESERDRQAA
ncbi:MAG: response regulator [Candidatus Eisenbacteria bacterium]|nr:response regulator [Candidatus Eisenbacteria bacterium]